MLAAQGTEPPPLRSPTAATRLAAHEGSPQQAPGGTVPAGSVAYSQPAAASSPGRWAAEEGARERRLRAPGGQEGREKPDGQGPRWAQF